MKTCFCCDNMAGNRAVPTLSDAGLQHLCPGCAHPNHRNADDAKRESDHMDPDWVGGRLDFGSRS